MRTPEEVGKSIEGIVVAKNSVSIDEIDNILRSISRDTALGPMVDPSTWQGGGKFDATRQTRKVMQAIRDFKAEVQGIGNLQKLDP